MRSQILRILHALACVLMVACVAQAQEINGTVTDPSGAVIPGAAVRVTSDGKVVADARSDNQGNYSIHLAQDCVSCRLTVSADGFTTPVRDITLVQAGHLVMPVRLQIAARPESVNIEAKSLPFVDQLDMSDVRDSTAKDVGEALTEVDGVYKIRKAGIANDVVVRGLQQGNINVLIDGAHIFAACPGHMDPAAQHVDFAEVERVDISKGAFDVTRSGSLGATVNVVTKTPPLGFRLTPSMAFGSSAFVNPSLTSSFGNESFRVLAGYSYRSSDPYKDGLGRSFLTYANYSAAGFARKSFEINTGWFETEFSPSQRQKVTLGYARQEGGLVLYPYLTMDADSDHADRFSLKYEIRDLPADVRAIRTQIYFTQVKHFMSDSQRSSALNGHWTMASDASTRAIGGQMEADMGRDATFGFESYYRNWNVLGYMTMMGMVGPASPSVPDVGTNVVGVFATYHHAFSDRIKLTGGVRFDHDSMSADSANLSTDAYFNYQGTRSSRAADVYPSGNLRLLYALPRHIELFAGAGTTGRIPDAEERYFSRTSMTSVNVGDPNLPIVRNTEATAGAIYRRGASYIKPTLFYSNINNYILVNNQPLVDPMAMGPKSARSYTNVDAHIYGGELSYAFGLRAGFSLTGGGAYSKGTNDRKPVDGVLDTHLPEMPPLRTWVALRYTRKFAFAELGGTGVSRQNLVSTDLQETPTAGYGLMNVKLGFSYRKWSASMMVDNLLNRYYYEHLSYYRDPFASGVKIPEPGRNVFSQLRYAF